MSSAPILRFENVSLAFDDVQALDNVSFSLPAGETRILLGAAGSGKTVLLKTALGLSKPDSGRVWLFGNEITGMQEKHLFPVRARVGILFQESALFDSSTIGENVAYPLENQPSVQCPKDAILPRVHEALRNVELEHTVGKYPSELSGGMRRRVGIARANVTAPELVFYDSPTAGLDPITANNIMALVIRQRDLRHTTTMMTSHRLQDGVLMANYRWNAEAGKIQRVTARDEQSDQRTKFMVMHEGRLVFEGAEEELEACRDPYVSKFVLRASA
jgi:phospholipid/cholesterol/gamma-HCH transport system ATP-binding protein